jgi:hypothetical protein
MPVFPVNPSTLLPLGKPSPAERTDNARPDAIVDIETQKKTRHRLVTGIVAAMLWHSAETGLGDRTALKYARNAHDVLAPGASRLLTIPIMGSF